MKDCTKIDKLIWSFPDISGAEKIELENHLAICSECREAFEIAGTLRNSSEKDKQAISEISNASFDAAVMRKIRAQKSPIAAPEKISNRYLLRLGLSFALAATVVMFLVKSISDLGEIRTPATTSQKNYADKYGYINIELGHQAQTTAPPEAKEAPQAYPAAPKKQGEMPARQNVELLPPSRMAKDTGQVLALQPPPKTTSFSDTTPQIASVMSDTANRSNQYSLNNVATGQPPSVSIMGKSRMKTLSKSLVAGNAPTAPETAPLQGGATMSFHSAAPAGFSILSSPLGKQAPDSVNIDAIYVTNENISRNLQTQAASINEIFKDTGSVQTQMPQSSILVTVEKMPKALKIVLPEYPVWARKQGLSGILWVRARVESDGHISDAEIVSCNATGLGFEEAALKAAKESLFTPASSNGINLPVWIVYPVKYIYKE